MRPLGMAGVVRPHYSRSPSRVVVRGAQAVATTTGTAEEQGRARAVAKKLEKLRDRKYVVHGEVLSLTSFFAVPKGVDDIRVVFDGTKSGLNAAI
jgi:hypothetical protein